MRQSAGETNADSIVFKKLIWAAAIIGRSLSVEQLQQFEAAWLDIWSNAQPSQKVGLFEIMCTAIWSFAQLLYYPKQLLQAVEQDEQLLQQCVDAASTQHLSYGRRSVCCSRAQDWSWLVQSHLDCSCACEGEGYCSCWLSNSR